MKKIFTAILCIVILLFPINISASNNVKVQIAPFYTEINGMSVDNRYVEFPLITYKGITYIPMTYILCEHLGLEATYDANHGLYISRGYLFGVSDEKLAFGGPASNNYPTLYDAYIVDYPVYLNGINIDNQNQEYPILNFRNITYFPMTWRFAYEELDFDIEWSDEEYSLKLRKNGVSGNPYPYADDGSNIMFQDKISVYDEDAEGFHLLYSYWERYKLNLASQQISRLDAADTEEKVTIPYNPGALNGKTIDATIKEDGIYIDGILAIAADTTDYTSVTANEYKLEVGSLIYLYAMIGNAPPPYTQHNEYLLYRDGGEITNLNWDTKNNFSGIYPDSQGGYYIASSGYSPMQTGRWSNSFSDIYFFTPKNKTLTSLAEKFSKTHNSFHALGIGNGKLYVEAMWYDADKYSAVETNHFSAINSGFFALDLTNETLDKLYPYILGETFIASDGNLYCTASYARNPRLINLCTKQIISF